MRFFKSIKFRLTGWYLIVIIVIVVLLLVFGLLAYLMLSNNLYQNLDDSLKARATQLAGSYQQGHVSFEERLSELVMVYNATGTTIQKIGPNVEITDIDRLVKQAMQAKAAPSGYPYRFPEMAMQRGKFILRLPRDKAASYTGRFPRL